MIRWEYNTIVDAVNNMAESVPALDEAGRDGWEVIAVQVNAFGITYLMKKPLPPTETAKGSEDLVKHSHSTRFMCSSACPQHGTINEITG